MPCQLDRLSRAAALLALAFGTLAQAQMPASLVRVDEVRLEPLVQTVPVLGRLVAGRAGTVAARISGPVETLHVEVGSRVEKGQLLAELNTATLDAARRVAAAGLAEARARLETRKAELALARQERTRLERLRDATSKSLMEDARQGEVIAAARVAEGEAALASAQAALRLTELNLDYAQVRAPYPGVVTDRPLEIGSYVQQGQAVVRLVSDSGLEVEVDVPFERLSGLSPGAMLALSLDDGTEHQARVRAVIPEENPKTRTRRVRLVPTFGTTRLALAAEQSATVHVPVGAPREVLSVHKDAINRSGERDLVFVVEPGEGEQPGLVARPRQVRLGEPVGNRLEVLQGLAEGDRAVVRGNERLRPNAPVRVEGTAS